ncbi:MAG: helix-turn-helix transcriptional regulator [Actinomycetota bacterium]|nr:helix-turn-helix transcriptional regulator [Actinomycetota bacterium]
MTTYLRLTRRQAEALNWAADGLTQRETARRMGISFRTVSHHLQGARERVGARSTSQAVVKLLESGGVIFTDNRRDGIVLQHKT